MKETKYYDPHDRPWWIKGESRYSTKKKGELKQKGRYTEEEDNIIRENFGTLTIMEIADMLERPSSSIHSRIKALKLKG